MFKNILLIVATIIVVANSGCSTTPPTPVTAILHPGLEQAGDQMVSDWKQAEKNTLLNKEGPEIKTRVIVIVGFGSVKIPASWADPVQDPQDPNGWYSCGEDGRLAWSTGPMPLPSEAVDKGKGRLDWETSTTLFAVQMHGGKSVRLELPKISYSKSWKKAWKEELSKFQD